MLADLYSQAFDPRFHHFTATRLDAAKVSEATGEPVDLVTVEMPGGSAVFAAEAGTHLFIPPHAATVPVQVFVYPLGADDDPLAHAAALFARRAAWRAGRASGGAADHAPADNPSADPFALRPVVRVYDQSNAAIDLRTGAVAPGRPARADLRRLMLAALPVPAELVS